MMDMITFFLFAVLVLLSFGFLVCASALVKRAVRFVFRREQTTNNHATPRAASTGPSLNLSQSTASDNGLAEFLGPSGDENLGVLRMGLVLKTSLINENDDNHNNGESDQTNTNEEIFLMADMGEGQDLIPLDEACAICLSEYEHGESILLSNRCQHVFHKSCIQDWLKQNDACPCCRAPFRGVILEDVDPVTIIVPSASIEQGERVTTAATRSQPSVSQTTTDNNEPEAESSQNHTDVENPITVNRTVDDDLNSHDTTSPTVTPNVPSVPSFTFQTSSAQNTTRHSTPSFLHQQQHSISRKDARTMERYLREAFQSMDDFPFDEIKYPQTLSIRWSLSNQRASSPDTEWDDDPMMVCGICHQEFSLRDRFTVNQQDVECHHVFHERCFLEYCQEHSFFLNSPSLFNLNTMGKTVRIPCAICRRSYMQIDPSMSYIQV